MKKVVLENETIKGKNYGIKLNHKKTELKTYGQEKIELKTSR